MPGLAVTCSPPIAGDYSGEGGGWFAADQVMWVVNGALWGSPGISERSVT